MVFAAGLGRRMLPLTRDVPKPLLEVAGKPLIAHLIERLRRAGFTELVINIAYLGEKIRQFCGDGRHWGVDIAYSPEARPLETGGGLWRALPLLGDGPFMVINSDIWTDYPLQQLRARALPAGVMGHLVMVPNPEHRRQGDYGVDAGGFLSPLQGEGEDPAASYTFSGISLMRPQMIACYPRCRERFALAEVFDHYIGARQLAAEVYRGLWHDIGTPQRLAALRRDSGH